MFEIGSTLRDARVRRDISLQQAEDETKIRVKYIQAMENEDFDILPGGTYVKGFLRTYAEYLGIDYQLLLDEYNDRYGSGEHREHIIQSTRPAKAETAAAGSPRSQKNRNYILVAVLAVAIITVLAYLGWGNAASNKPTLITTTENGGAAQTAPEEPSAPAASPPSPPARTAPTQTQTQPAVLETVVITSTETRNWVELHRGSATGEVIWGGTLSPGDSRSFGKSELGAEKVWLQVGSATGLQVKVNGKDQDVPGVVGATYVISATGMSSA